MAYLVDTNIMVDFTRGSVRSADYLDSLRRDCFLSSIRALELIGGARSQREVSDQGFVLVTKNRKHFQMTGDLKLVVPNY